MTAPNRPLILATRGSALALAQANMVLAQCRAAFPDAQIDIKIFKTTGDKLQAFAPTSPVPEGGKGLFTKELEAALLSGEADFAVHSLKDLPTDLPDGLRLGAVGRRADVRDILIYRDAGFLPPSGSGNAPMRGLGAGAKLADFPQGAVIATSSTRRQAQLLAERPDLVLVPIRGNVGTRLHKLADQAGLDGLVLAAAGFQRLGFQVRPDGRVTGEGLPDGLLGIHFSTEEMLPCVGQAAIGIEIRAGDPAADAVCAALDDLQTHQCVVAERAFLKGMGGGCLSPVAAFAEVNEGRLRLRAVSFREPPARRGELTGSPGEAASLGARMAEQLKRPA